MGPVHLRVVVLSEGVRRVGRDALFNCEWLVCVQSPSTLLETGNWAFRGCISLANLQFPEGLAVIHGHSL